MNLVKLYDKKVLKVNKLKEKNAKFKKRLEKRMRRIAQAILEEGKWASSLDAKNLGGNDVYYAANLSALIRELDALSAIYNDNYVKSNHYFRSTIDFARIVGSDDDVENIRRIDGAVQNFLYTVLDYSYKEVDGKEEE